MSEFLVYGRPAKVRRDFVTMTEPVTHWTCGQPQRIDQGDTIWIVTVFSGRLTLIAPLLIGAFASYNEAQKRCRESLEFFVPAEHMTGAYIMRLNSGKMNGYISEAVPDKGGMHIKTSGYEPFEKPHHAFAADNGEFAKFLDISDYAAQLRFISPGDKDRLAVTDGLVDNPQQLQAMRQLTDTSAALLRKIWYDAGSGLRDIPDIASPRKSAKSPPPKSLLKKTDRDELQRLNRQFPKINAERRKRMIESIERGRVGEAMKKYRDHKCQICAAIGINPVGFATKCGIPYTEAHHVEEVGKGGDLGPENIVVLCANHHRQMHSGNVALVQKTVNKFVFRIDGKQIAVARYSP